MYSVPNKPVPRDEIAAEHMRTLEEAVDNAADYGIKMGRVHKAIDYFTANCLRKGGVNLYLYGLKNGSPTDMAAGLMLLKKHLGMN